MSVCVGVNCYEQVTKNNILYFIRSDVYTRNKITEETKSSMLMQMSDFAFNIVKSAYGTHELFKCK